MSVESPARVERRALLRYVSSRWKRSELATYPQNLTVPDPGHGIDEVCPIVYFGTAFDPTKSEDLAALSSYATRELAGYGYYELDVQDGEWAGQQLPINIVGNAWVLESPGGPVTVYPQSDVEDGATVVFQLDDESTFTAVVSATWLHGVGYLVMNLTEIRAEVLDAGSRGKREAQVRMLLMIAAPRSAGPKISEEYSGALCMLLRGVRFVPDATAPAGTLERDLADSGTIHLYQSARDPIQERPNRVGERDGWAWYSLQIIIRRIYRLPRAGVQPIAVPA